MVEKDIVILFSMGDICVGILTHWGSLDLIIILPLSVPFSRHPLHIVDDLMYYLKALDFMGT